MNYSGVKHLEEIRNAGFPMPSVNQIEVRPNKKARIHSNTKVYDFELKEEDVAALDALDRGKDGAISWNPVDAD
ncbi:hypothetical protein C0993_011168 [Termitomyces sp. T159_Od127]|nr:hypothetical protein C0993_011168 [Termitomyces sp. T159_Od127]